MREPWMDELVGRVAVHAWTLEELRWEAAGAIARAREAVVRARRAVVDARALRRKIAARRTGVDRPG